MKQYYHITSKGKAFVSAIDAGLLKQDENGAVSTDQVKKFETFFSDLVRKGIVNQSDDAGYVVKRESQENKRNFKKYLKYGAKYASLLLLGFLIKCFLTG